MKDTGPFIYGYKTVLVKKSNDGVLLHKIAEITYDKID